jgi:hypothetical protein|tara:strand:- start:311 stop:508 length:198 start_codon:yes stop_codon:yes gene_type:complete
MKLQIFRKTNLYKDGREYLLDIENDNKPAQFDSLEDILNLFKSEGHEVETKEDLANLGMNIEKVE